MSIVTKICWVGLLSSFVFSLNIRADDYWVQWNSESEKELRFIVPENVSCSDVEILVEGEKSASTLRQDVNDDFSNRVCQSVVGNTAEQNKSVYLGNHFIKHKVPERLLIIGDTGCRVSPLGKQLCYDEEKWPFRKMMSFAEDMNPDAVVHVGDYLYKAVPCPFDDDNKCYKHYGDTWGNWKEEFIDPAGNLLKTVPWVFVRGNHEKCKSPGRMGEGFFRMFSGAGAKCVKNTPIYNVDLGNVNLIIADVASIKKNKGFTDNIRLFKNVIANIRSFDDFKLGFSILKGIMMPKKKNNNYLDDLKVQFENLNKYVVPGKHNWFLLHIPMYAVHDNSYADFSNTMYDEAGVSEIIPDSIDLIISGDIHSGQAITFKKGIRRPQFIIGNGGSSLYKYPLDSSGYRGKASGSDIFDYVNIINEFGFVIADFNKEKDSWKMKFIDQYEKTVMICEVMRGGNIDCH